MEGNSIIYIFGGRDMNEQLSEEFNSVNVLIIENRKENLTLLQEIFNDSKKQLLMARTGEEALKYVAEEDIAVILLDLQMSGLNGYDTAKIIRAGEKSKDIPIIFLSSKHSDEDVLHGYAVGGNDFITKPFHPEIIRKKIDNYVNIYINKEKLKSQNTILKHRTKEFDITKERLKNITAELRRSQIITRLISKTSLNTIVTFDQYGRIQSVNPMVLYMFGYQPHEIINKSIQTLIPISAHNSFVDKINKLREFRINAQRKDGSIFQADIHLAQAVIDEQLLYVCTIDYAPNRVDIESKPKDVWHSIEETFNKNDMVLSNLKLDSILEHISDGFFILDKEFKFKYMNSEAEIYFQRIIDKKKEQLIDSVIWDVFSKFRNNELYSHFYNVVNNKFRLRTEWTSPYSNKDFELKIYPSKEGLYVFFSDITGRKKLEMELLKSLDGLNSILASVTDPFYVIDNDWCIIYINEGAQKFFFNGYTKDIIGKNLWDILREIKGIELYHDHHKALNERIAFSKEIYYSQNEKHYEMCFYPFHNGLSVLLRDVTKNKNDEVEIYNLAQLVKSSDDAIISGTINGSITSWNEGAERLTGYKFDEVVGKSAMMLIPEEHKTQFKEILEQLKRGKSKNNIESKWVRNDGQTIYVNLSIYSLIDSKGQIIGYSLISRDISDKKYFDKEIARLERLNLIAQIAAGVAHEIRNPMSTVYGFLQLLMKEKDLEKYQSHFQMMLDELERINTIIKEFLLVAKYKTTNKVEKNLNDIIDAIKPLCKAAAIKENKNIIVEKENIDNTYLDEKEIRQLILNLVRNGLEAMKDHGNLLIKTFMQDEEVVLLVQDEGTGIPQDIIEKIGMPFFTTKENGTGLGLAICNSIAARHESKLRIKTGSEGTAISLHFQAIKKDT